MIRVLVCLLALILSHTDKPKTYFVNDTSDIRSLVETQDINYTESFDDTINADRGFYKPIFYRFKTYGNVAPQINDPLAHLRLDLSLFTAEQNNGEEIPLTENMLNCLDGMLSYIESKNHCAIVRFAYDPWFNGTEVSEPSLEMILKHQEQIGTILSKHKNAIVCVETGLLGKWGELHGTEMCNGENLVAVVDKWLDVLSDSITVSVRTPGHYCFWRNIDRKNISEDVSEPDERAYRIGIYNDGYLGSATDLGTYANREEEINWISVQTKHSLFGGELLKISDLNDGQTYSSFIENEAFLTHTSYLNVEYHDAAINELKNEIYNSIDRLYRGQTGFTYIKNRLGYRLVLKSIRMSREVPLNDNILLQARIDNAGFGNIVKPKKLFLVLEGTDNNIVYTFPITDHIEKDDEYVINADPTKWDSATRTYLRVFMRLPSNTVPGEYKAYLKIAYSDTYVDAGYYDYPVRFANDDEDMWNEGLGANYIGRLRVIESRK